MTEEQDSNSSAAVAGLLDQIVIPHGGYKCIVADPPWAYGKWGAASDSETARKKFPNGQWSEQFDKGYSHLSTEEIASMPVGSIAADDCDLYLWTTGKYLPVAFEVMKAWGFKYCQTLTWCKVPRGTGQGGLYCPTTEFILLGRRGKMPKGKTRVDSTWWQVKRTNKHSKKPEFFQDLIEQMSNGPRIELFARRPRDGWDVWGNEV